MVLAIIGVTMFFSLFVLDVKKVVEVTESEIKDVYARYKSIYNKNLILGKDPVKTSSLSVPRHRNCNVLYESPITTFLLEDYSKRGINLTEISKFK